MIAQLSLSKDFFGLKMLVTLAKVDKSGNSCLI